VPDKELNIEVEIKEVEHADIKNGDIAIVLKSYEVIEKRGEVLITEQGKINLDGSDPVSVYRIQIKPSGQPSN
jgi:hypothetical protein